MSWRISVGFLAVTSSILQFGSAVPVRADDAFLCGPSTVVYVKADELEFKKRTDPCIAAYFGLPVDEVKKASLEAASKTGAAAGAPFERGASFPHAAQGEPLTQVAVNTAPVAAAGTDYRNVRIINAEPGAAAWFVHSK